MRFMLLCVVYGLLFYCEQTDSCITLWNPVCGVDGKTYSNACFVPRRLNTNVPSGYRSQKKSLNSVNMCCKRRLREAVLRINPTAKITTLTALSQQ
ncbi:uncharacterized protein LOC111102424 isoform X1 [Crassostrea virginica]